MKLVLEALARRHRELLEEAAAIRRALDRDPAVPDLLRDVFGTWTDALGFHVRREEAFLFPSLHALGEGDVEAAAAIRATLRRVELEHRELDALQQRVRQIAHQAGEMTQRILHLFSAREHHDRVEHEQLLRLVDGSGPRVSP